MIDCNEHITIRVDLRLSLLLMVLNGDGNEKKINRFVDHSRRVLILHFCLPGVPYRVGIVNVIWIHYSIRLHTIKDVYSLHYAWADVVKLERKTAVMINIAACF